jgi:hypothetical protein
MWAEQNAMEWKRDPDELKSAQILLDEFTTPYWHRVRKNPFTLLFHIIARSWRPSARVIFGFCLYDLIFSVLGSFIDWENSREYQWV